MIDIKIIRENPEAVRENLKKRQNPQIIKLFDELLEADALWRKEKAQNDSLRKERNEASLSIAKLMKEGKKEEAEKSKSLAKEIAEKLKAQEQKLEDIAEKRRQLQMRVPNILEEDVPYGESDEDNVEIKKWGEPKEAKMKESHGEWLESKGLADFERSTKISGAGFYFLKSDLVLLNQALLQYALQKLSKLGYAPIEVPYMMRTKPYEGVTDIHDFEDVMYKIQDDDLHMIATSEHPMAAMYMDESLNGKELPIKYAGLSMNFRKEIGSHGVDTRGLFRVHQFSKVEQFVFCRPEESSRIHEELLKNSEELIQDLNLPYRVVNICTGDIGIVASKKYDIEVWMPREQKYREVTSCSNCTSYQAVRLNIRYDESGERNYVHTLNSTAYATSRIMRAILENNYNEDGTVSVPEVLQPFMMGKRVIGNAN